jgi:hypothetical protein
LSAAFWDEVGSNVWSSISAEDVAFLIGQLVVSPGLGVLRKSFEVAWKSVAKAAALVLSRVAVRAGMVAVKTIPYTLAEIKATADGIIEALEASGKALGGVIHERIRMEVSQQTQAVVEALEILQKAVSEAQGERRKAQVMP